MSIFKIITFFLSSKELTEYKQIKRIIKKKGYKVQDSDTFIKESRKGSTMIWISNSSVKIKVYFNGYADSESLSRPMTKKALRDFIESNEI